MKPRVLIVEDNPDLAFGLRNNLEIEGYDVAVSEDGPNGVERAREWKPDVMILDLMLPGMDGYTVLRTLRDSGFTAPVLMLTARGEEADKVKGLRSGADDYVTKPFGVLELLARVEALLRRATGANAGRAGAINVFGRIAIDRAARTVTRSGAAVALAPMEYDLLVALVDRDGAVVSRVDLMRHVWGYDASIVSRTVDTHVVELRRKLEDDPSSPKHILTVRKAGYRLQP
ncbi:MAG TPA: response regulator transcription factor [Gemmatimonadaceae bacterium]|nr:response regulator transcription factor [Gemmatimonadaceae bacterium]